MRNKSTEIVKCNTWSSFVLSLLVAFFPTLDWTTYNPAVVKNTSTLRLINMLRYQGRLDHPRFGPVSFAPYMTIKPMTILRLNSIFPKYMYWLIWSIFMSNAELNLSDNHVLNHWTIDCLFCDEKLMHSMELYSVKETSRIIRSHTFSMPWLQHLPSMIHLLTSRHTWNVYTRNLLQSQLLQRITLIRLI